MSKRHRLDIGDSSAKMPKTDDGGGGQHIEGAPTEQDLINIKKVRRLNKCCLQSWQNIHIHVQVNTLLHTPNTNMVCTPQSHLHVALSLIRWSLVCPKRKCPSILTRAFLTLTAITKSWKSGWPFPSGNTRTNSSKFSPRINASFSWERQVWKGEHYGGFDAFWIVPYPPGSKD